MTGGQGSLGGGKLSEHTAEDNLLELEQQREELNNKDCSAQSSTPMPSNSKAEEGSIDVRLGEDWESLVLSQSETGAPTLEDKSPETHCSTFELTDKSLHENSRSTTSVSRPTRVTAPMVFSVILGEGDSEESPTKVTIEQDSGLAELSSSHLSACGLSDLAELK